MTRFIQIQTLFKLRVTWMLNDNFFNLKLSSTNSIWLENKNFETVFWDVIPLWTNVGKWIIEIVIEYLKINEYVRL